MFVKRLLYILLLLSIVLVAAGCDDGGDDDPDDDTATTLEGATELPVNPDETLSTDTTSEMESTATEMDSTDEADTGDTIGDDTETDDDSASGDASAYTLMVNNVETENFDESMGDPAEGMQWVLIDAALNGMDGTAAALVDAERLFLIDTDGNRYSPESPTGGIDSPLVGGSVDADTTLEGSVLFSIPEDATPSILEWCLDDTCTEVVQASAEM